MRVKGDETIPFILVGNKSDLQDRRMVPLDKARGQAEAWKVPYVGKQSVSGGANEKQ